ncbi:unnamed protein product [Cuscuta epithymum]|uniref:Uncharacterized protein n=1 Tax=Cuscuta epithymum TaxID=186058 RepID=A0AAV0EWD9_9ASTE|nr:unnamed protein product [Cuscuta epithymum]
MGDAYIEVESELPEVVAAGEEKFNEDVDRELIRSMEKELSADWPRRRVGKLVDYSCCIFRVPVRFGQRGIVPSTVSIGPYHDNKREEYRAMEKNKRRSLASLLERTREEKGLTLEDYFVKVKCLEEEARDYYSEAIPLASHEFLAILVVDGCFIVELFRKWFGIVDLEEDDPLFIFGDSTAVALLNDLLSIENQIPFFVLQALFDLTKSPDDDPGWSLPFIFLNIFRDDPSFSRPEAILDGVEGIRWRHLLEILRWSFIQRLPQREPPRKPPGFAWSRAILRQLRGTKAKVVPKSRGGMQCISKLRKAGIKPTPSKEGDSVRAIGFNGGTIVMPPIRIDGFMAAFLQNCVVYEQYLPDRCKSITEYAIFLDRLIDTHADVGVLREEGVLTNYYGTDGELAKAVNELVKGVNTSFCDEEGDLSQVSRQINLYYNSTYWHFHWAAFKDKYFNSPWSSISFFAAIVLLLLSVTQTVFAILPYFKPLHYDKKG